jgi:hypothetical protein
VTSATPGTLGIGVGELLPPIPERGETSATFHSIVWFPYEAADEAIAYAAEHGYSWRRGVAL